MEPRVALLPTGGPIVIVAWPFPRGVSCRAGRRQPYTGLGDAAGVSWCRRGIDVAPSRDLDLVPKAGATVESCNRGSGRDYASVAGIDPAGGPAQACAEGGERAFSRVASPRHHRAAAAEPSQTKACQGRHVPPRQGGHLSSRERHVAVHPQRAITDFVRPRVRERKREGRETHQERCNLGRCRHTVR
jgi:hypothetical protein